MSELLTVDIPDDKLNSVREEVMDQLLTVDELAERLKVPKSCFYSRSRQTGPDAIPRVPVGKYIRFELNSVMAWLRNQGRVDSSDSVSR